MPKKKGNKKRKNKGASVEARQLLEKQDDQEYARVVKVLGNARYLLQMNLREKQVIGRLRGTMRRRRGANWTGLDSVVLVGLRDFQDNTVDILHVYNDQEVRHLKKNGDFIEETNKLVHKEDQKEEVEDDVGFDFDEI